MLLPALYAHRLGRGYGPDSSAGALNATLAQPIAGIETDVCLTLDRQLVCLHDPYLPLATTATGWSYESSARRIRDARILDAHGQRTDERPLLVEDVLERVPPETVMQLEVKAHADPALARETTEVLCRWLESIGRRQRERIEILSFFSAACAAAAARGLRARLVTWADYLPEALASWAREHGIHGVSVEHFLISEQLVSTLRLAGLSVNTGTINHVEVLSRVMELGVDAVCTDRPHELARELAQRQVGLPAQLRAGMYADRLAA